VTHIESARALSFAARIDRCGKRRAEAHLYRPGPVMRYAGRTVTMASRFRPYAIGHHRLARARHIVRAVYVCWWRGRIDAILVIAWCGCRLATAELVGDEVRAFYDCGMCAFRRAAR